MNGEINYAGDAWTACLCEECILCPFITAIVASVRIPQVQVRFPRAYKVTLAVSVFSPDGRCPFPGIVACVTRPCGQSTDKSVNSDPDEHVQRRLAAFPVSSYVASIVCIRTKHT